MKYRQLIKAAKQHLQSNPVYVTGMGRVFNNGGEWMRQRLSELRGSDIKINNAIPYAGYGLAKYIICGLVFIGSIAWLSSISFWLLPVSVIVFYVVEIHFLFLFPLLIDKMENPVLESIRLTYRAGFGKTLITVMPIGIYMMAGLFDLKDPLKNWHIGCLAVLIWYEQETGNRKRS